MEMHYADDVVPRFRMLCRKKHDVSKNAHGHVRRLQKNLINMAPKPPSSVSPRRSNKHGALHTEASERGVAFAFASDVTFLGCIELIIKVDRS